MHLGAWHAGTMPAFAGVAGFGLIILSASYSTRGLKQIFDCRNFQFIGDISYSIYLVHLPLVFAYMTLRKVLLPDDPKALLFGYTFSPGETWAGLVVFLVIIPAGATLTYRYVEKPARKYLNKTRQPVAVA